MTFRPENKPIFADIVAATAAETGVSPAAILGKESHPEALTARHLALYVAAAVFWHEAGAVERKVARTHTTVRRAKERIEALVAVSADVARLVQAIADRAGEMADVAAQYREAATGNRQPAAGRQAVEGRKKPAAVATTRTCPEPAAGCLSPAAASEARRLRGLGWSVTSIARRLDVDAGLVARQFGLDWGRPAAYPRREARA